ncbi:hypothetical protein [Lactobacillus sp. ESL0677]|uniref:hypothetical protein n=1 Tax=Lactobacillus sp. ESL0677 TaxID=2983208 RepID=UPI0023F95544|nr:hypothetical protein [Lactobacillus sp. ESL0677]WEV37090.1 hypothetical protein OZX76_00460 [Lactobacillus sp. ESL0677]
MRKYNLPICIYKIKEKRFMQNPADLTKETNLFKTRNSWAFRVLKQDKEFLHADSNTRFKKTISPDGKQITSFILLLK